MSGKTSGNRSKIGSANKKTSKKKSEASAVFTQFGSGFDILCPRWRASPFVIAAFGSALAMAQSSWAADAAGGVVTNVYGGVGGAGNGHGGAGGDNTGSGTVGNNGAAASNGDGGNGGASKVGASGGSGGTAGTVATSTSITVTSDSIGGAGGDGTSGGSYSSGGGGGGGAGLQASSDSITINSGVTVSGGDGGDGGTSGGGGGGGGGGGAGVVATAAGATIDNDGTLTGGSGGAGGNGFAGGGGGGGDGLLITGGSVRLSNSGSITGGSGGAGGSGTPAYWSGYSGAGGAGINLTAGGNTIVNTGSIAGGNGGSGIYNGAGGAGIITYGNDTIINSGTISGGLSGDGVTQANAILFNGTGNRLELLTGSTINGAIELASSSSATIAAQNSGLSLSSAILLGTSTSLTFDTSTGQGLDVSGVISGYGTVTVSGGTSAIVFTADNTYTGITTISGGTLQIGDGGTTGTLGSADVVDNRSLVFNRSDSVTIANAISGTGTVTQAGTGTTILTSTNSYSGTTTISAGTLQIGNGGTTGTLGSGNVVDNGSLVFNRSDSVSIANAISGTGAVTQAGTGTTILTGNNSYSGTTTISAGTLQIGDGGTSGTLGSGDVINDGTLIVDRSDSVTIVGNISGTGTVTQAGTGTTILTGSNSYSGITTISAGTLQIGDGGTSGTLGSGDVVDNGSLVFNRSDSVTIANAISGTGTVTQAGTGTTILTGSSLGYVGTIDVDSGVLQVDGSIGGSTTVNSGGTLAGTGTVGSTSIKSGGTLSAGGSSIGTLTVDGTLQLDSGSYVLVDIAGNGTSDLVSVAGNASVDGTVKVTTLDSKTSYRTGQTYTILSSDTAVTGTFTTATTTSSFLKLALGYTATSVNLTITMVGSFGEAGNTPNQRATGTALDTLEQSGSSLELYNKLLLLSSEEAPRAFDMLSGEIHASLKTALFEDSSFVRDAFIGRLRTIREDTEQGLWASGYGAWDQMGGDSPNAARLTGSTGGVIVGADTLLPGNWQAGIAGGYGVSNDNLNDRASSSRVDSYTLGTYAGTQLSNFALRLGVSNTWHSIDTSRNSSFSGFDETNKASYWARTTQAFGEAGYSMATGTATFEPYVGLAYVNLNTNAYNENGIAGLRGQASSQNLLYSSLGGRVDAPVTLGQATGHVRAGLSWRHAEGDTTSATTHAFDGSDAFTVTGVPIARDIALLEAGLDLGLGEGANFSVSYKGQIAAHTWQNSFVTNLRVKF